MTQTAQHASARSATGPWICVALMVIGFVGGAVSFCARAWIPFGICGALIVGAGVAALALGIMQNTE